MFLLIWAAVISILTITVLSGLLDGLLLKQTLTAMNAVMVWATLLSKALKTVFQQKLLSLFLRTTMVKSRRWFSRTRVLKRKQSSCSHLPNGVCGTLRTTLQTSRETLIQAKLKSKVQLSSTRLNTRKEETTLLSIQ